MRYFAYLALIVSATLVACGGGGGISAPAITAQPQSTSVKAGQSVTFTVVATGSGTLSYQWSKNAAAIAGATRASYTFSSPALADSGDAFTVAVTNADGTATSAAAVLTVIPYLANSGVAQKGPLVMGSTVTAQELDGTLSPIGKQYSYQITSDLGTFAPTSTFGSQYIGLNATGYYFDEVQNSVSTGPITINGFSDISVAPVLNVNLLTTLAYQRIQKLVASGMAFSRAQMQAQNEVLASLGIPSGSYHGTFGSLDIAKGADGDYMLAAISSLFVYGNSADALGALVASAQSDIGANGSITSSSTRASLAAASAAVIPDDVALHLSEYYWSAGITFQPGQIAAWIDQDAAGVVGKFKFYVPNASSSSSFIFPSFVPKLNAGLTVSVSTGQLTVNGHAANGPVVISATDALAVSPGSSSFGASGVLTVFLMSGTAKLARVQFISPTADIWIPTAYMTNARSFAAAALLNTGQILVSGGVGGLSPLVNYTAEITNTTELYDATNNVWVLSGNLVTARYSHTATTLNSGKVLLAAGVASDGQTALQSAELYDPTAGKWSATGSLIQARYGHTATLLPNGKVLVVGGRADNGATALQSAELYDPATGSWSSAGNMVTARANHTATLLGNGLVLIAGGNEGSTTYSSAELYDPGNNTWSAAGNLTTPRSYQTATVLQNGSVLLAGGFSNADFGMASTDVYDPATNTFAASGNLATGRYGHAAALLPSGRVLVAGGVFCKFHCTAVASAELYDPGTGTWGPAASMASARAYSAIAPIAGGGVLVAGGDIGESLGEAEIYW